MENNIQSLDELEKHLINSITNYESDKPYKKKEVKYSGWSVDIHGNMDFNGKYFIENNRLKENNWFIHLWGKHWMKWDDFIPAFYQACYNADIKEFTQIISNEK